MTGRAESDSLVLASCSSFLHAQENARYHFGVKKQFGFFFPLQSFGQGGIGDE